MENKMETTIVYWGYIEDGKQNGNNYSILGVILKNGKQNGNNYSILGLY